MVGSDLTDVDLSNSDLSKGIFNESNFLILFTDWSVEPSFIKIIAPGFSNDTEKLKIAIDLTRITFPFLFFISLASFFSAILNSHNKFAAASAAPIILNMVLITILFFGRYLGDELIYYLSYGVSIAGLLQLIFLYRFVKKYYIWNVLVNGVKWDIITVHTVEVM